MTDTRNAPPRGSRPRRGRRSVIPLDHARTVAVSALDACERGILEALHATAEAGGTFEAGVLEGR